MEARRGGERNLPPWQDTLFGEGEDEDDERIPLHPKYRQNEELRRKSYYKGQYRYFLFGLAFLQTLCASGVVLGWAALAALLHQRSIYRGTDCSTTTTTPPVDQPSGGGGGAVDGSMSGEDSTGGQPTWCQEQQARLALVYALGLIGMYASRAAFAWFMDTFGAKRTAVVGSIVFGLGAFLFILALDQGDLLLLLFLRSTTKLLSSRAHTHTHTHTSYAYGWVEHLQRWISTRTPSD
jgi:MFS family permease